MTSRERIRTIISGKPADRCGFWLGMPHDDTWPIYLKHFGFTEQEDVRRYLQDDLRWMPADWGGYKHPEGKALFNWGNHAITHGIPPIFADCETVAEVEAYEWPNAEYLDIEPILAALRNAGDVYRASGTWTCFFHIVADLFGMEEYFVKMYTHPEVVEAVTNHVCDFYYAANERFFAEAKDEVDCYFFGNDLGTQLDLLLSPELFDKFVRPQMQRFIDQGHKHGYQVMLHCCGAVSRLMDRFIDCGIDALHPLQALAANMDADTLSKRFKGRIAFVGGIDTQDLLMNATPEEVKADVRRVKDLLGPCLVVSPSHEALLPNVPPENVLAMAEEARAGG